MARHAEAERVLGLQISKVDEHIARLQREVDEDIPRLQREVDEDIARLQREVDEKIARLQASKRRLESERRRLVELDANCQNSQREVHQTMDTPGSVMVPMNMPLSCHEHNRLVDALLARYNTDTDL